MRAAQPVSFLLRADHGLLNIAPTGSLLFITIEPVGSVSGAQGL